LKTRHTYHYEILEGRGGGGKKLLFSGEFYWLGGDQPPAVTQGGDSEAEVVHFGVISDNQLGREAFHAILRAMKTVQKNIHYLVHAGDAVQEYDSLQQWDTHFAQPLSRAYQGGGAGHQETMEEMDHDGCILSASVPPIVYAHGNHDADPTDMYWQSTGPKEGANYFALSVADVRIVSLDSWPPDLPLTPMLDWLRVEAQSPAWKRAAFRVAVFHQPPFVEHWDAVSWHGRKESRWNGQMRTVLLPELLRWGVDLVVNGHQHAYQRGWLTPPLAKALTSTSLAMYQNSSRERAEVRALARKVYRRPGRLRGEGTTPPVNGSATGATNAGAGAGADARTGTGTATATATATATGTATGTANGTGTGSPAPVDVYTTAPGHLMLTVVGGGGGDLDLYPVELWGHVERTVTHRHHFAVMSVAGGRLQWRVYDVQGRVVDAFDLLRR
jgi:predicted phosphodiesterase